MIVCSTQRKNFLGDKKNEEEPFSFYSIIDQRFGAGRLRWWHH